MHNECNPNPLIATSCKLGTKGCDLAHTTCTTCNRPMVLEQCRNPHCVESENTTAGWEQVANLLADLRETCKSHNVTPADWMTALITELMTVAMAIDADTAEETMVRAIKAYIASHKEAAPPPPSGRRPFGRPCVENDRCGFIGCANCDKTP